MEFTVGKILVTHDRLYKDAYNSTATVLSSKQYRLYRRFPFSSWRVLDSFGLGNDPGSEYHWLPIKLGTYSYWDKKDGHRLRVEKLKQERIMGWVYSIIEKPASEGVYPSYRSEWIYQPSLWERLFNGFPRQPDADVTFVIEAKTSLGCFDRGYKVAEYRIANKDITGRGEPDTIKSLHAG